MKKQELSNSKLILSGFLIVNLPVTIIIISTIYILYSYTSLKFTESGIIGCVIAWILWEFLSKVWIKWALNQDVEENRLHKIGMYSLVLWKSDLKKIQKINRKLGRE
ncbi:hypothetical protein [Flavobacterium sp.]|uniref:hypothetical protein n=1 Tax=Flavobacterium sp. TaxID=239 RepID=UPI003D290882